MIRIPNDVPPRQRFELRVLFLELVTLVQRARYQCYSEAEGLGITVISTNRRPFALPAYLLPYGQVRIPFSVYEVCLAISLFEIAIEPIRLR
jgi:hypothetical protein